LLSKTITLCARRYNNLEIYALFESVGCDEGGEDENNNLNVATGNDVPSETEKPSPQAKAGKRMYFELQSNNPLEPCALGTNHVWDELASGCYVTSGALSGAKWCIGERNREVCDRFFIAKALMPHAKSAQNGNNIPRRLHETCVWVFYLP
jgi:hypothetical protein